jgi:hypothetical protein
MSLFRLVETGELPESYDVWLGGQLVGTVRVADRHLVTADCRGVVVHSAWIDGLWRTTPAERDRHLRLACSGVLAHLAGDGTVGGLYKLTANPPAVGRRTV